MTNWLIDFCSIYDFDTHDKAIQLLTVNSYSNVIDNWLNYWFTNSIQAIDSQINVHSHNKNLCFILYKNFLKICFQILKNSILDITEWMETITKKRSIFIIGFSSSLTLSLFLWTEIYFFRTKTQQKKQSVMPNIVILFPWTMIVFDYLGTIQRGFPISH